MPKSNCTLFDFENIRQRIDLNISKSLLYIDLFLEMTVFCCLGEVKEHTRDMH